MGSYRGAMCHPCFFTLQTRSDFTLRFRPLWSTDLFHFLNRKGVDFRSRFFRAPALTPRVEIQSSFPVLTPGTPPFPNSSPGCVGPPSQGKQAKTQTVVCGRRARDERERELNSERALTFAKAEDVTGFELAPTVIEARANGEGVRPSRK